MQGFKLMSYSGPWRQPGLGSDVDKPHLAILDHFMREVLLDVDVLGALPPLDACSVVLVHRSWGFLGEAHVLAEVARVDDLHSRRQRRIVLRFRRRQYRSFLHLRALYN